MPSSLSIFGTFKSLRRNFVHLLLLGLCGLLSATHAAEKSKEEGVQNDIKIEMQGVRCFHLEGGPLEVDGYKLSDFSSLQLESHESCVTLHFGKEVKPFLGETEVITVSYPLLSFFTNSEFLSEYTGHTFNTERSDSANTEPSDSAEYVGLAVKNSKETIPEFLFFIAKLEEKEKSSLTSYLEEHEIPRDDEKPQSEEQPVEPQNELVEEREEQLKEPPTTRHARVNPYLLFMNLFVLFFLTIYIPLTMGEAPPSKHKRKSVSRYTSASPRAHKR